MYIKRCETRREIHEYNTNDDREVIGTFWWFHGQTYRNNYFAPDAFGGGRYVRRDVPVLGRFL